MSRVEEQKLKLAQKKNRIAMEETKLKLKERKMRTRSLIEKGGLVVKAKLDNLEPNILYGALIYIKNELENNCENLTLWASLGNEAFHKELRETTPVILKFEAEPSSEVRSFIRSISLRYNRFRSEWYGNVQNQNLPSLKEIIAEIKHDLEVIGG